MNKDKSLTASIKTTLYQREKLVDKIQFLFPQKYEPKNINISDCTIVLKYTDQGNVAHAIELIPDDELYKDRIRCEMDVDLNLTKFAGDIVIYIDFLKVNSDNGIYESVLTSGETTITIQSRKDLFAYCADESLDIINKTMLELKAKQEAQDLIAKTYDEGKADSLALDTENSSIYLTSNGKPVGNSVLLNDLGDALADETDAGLVRVITEDEIEVPSDSENNESVKYTLQLNQDTDELLLLANGVIVSVIPTKDLGESIIDSTPEGLNEVVT